MVHLKVGTSLNSPMGFDLAENQQQILNKAYEIAVVISSSGWLVSRAINS